MSLVIERRVSDQISEGLHSVTITKVEDLGLEQTRFGMRDCAAIYFTPDDQEGKPVDVLMRLVKSLHPKSSLGKLLPALKVPFGDRFDLNELVGVRCEVVIQHKEIEGKIRATIAAVLKVRKRAGILPPVVVRRSTRREARTVRHS
jgi:hypothetical protein